MKYILYSIIFLSSCAATDEDFDNMAKDICDCMIDSTKVEKGNCVKELEDKYQDLNSYDSDEDFQKRLVESMKKVKGCEEYASFYESSLK